MSVPPKHKVPFLDAQSLETLADLPLGDCEFVEFAPFADTQRLVCQQSRNPSDEKKKPTLAFVALDVNRGAVLTWFDLGGERRGNWVGPMFFGYSDEAYTVPVRSSGTPCELETSLIDTVDLSERPASIVVLGRRDGPSKGDVWFVGPGPTDEPRLVTSLTRRPDSATICGNGNQLQIAASRY